MTKEQELSVLMGVIRDGAARLTGEQYKRFAQLLDEKADAYLEYGKIVGRHEAAAEIRKDLLQKAGRVFSNDRSRPEDKDTDTAVANGLRDFAFHHVEIIEPTGQNCINGFEVEEPIPF